MVFDKSGLESLGICKEVMWANGMGTESSDGSLFRWCNYLNLSEMVHDACTWPSKRSAAR